jgi:hypothetical protein
MLKYLNYKDCNNKNPSKFNIAKCNASLYKKITKNVPFIYYKRCLFMTFKEYSTEKIHINNNIYCKVFDSVSDGAIKSTIETELNNIKNNLIQPKGVKIPLPIYVMLAKKLEDVGTSEKQVFNGNYTVILYIPNLFNFNGNETAYTFFPSIDAFSKQNRWMELMTSSFSKYLEIVKIGSFKDKDDKIIKKNYLMNDLTHSCFNMGCVATDGAETFIIPAYSSKEAELSVSIENISPYYPKRCLKTPYFNKHMMNFKPADEKRFRGSTDVLSDTFDVDTHCTEANVKNYESEGKKDEETFDFFLCKQINKCKKYKGEEPKTDYDKIICDGTTNSEKVETLLSDFYRKNIKVGKDDKNYSAEYNNNIFKELAFRKSKYPGPDNIQEVVFSMFIINESVFDENLFCYMPWGNILLKQDFVINEGDDMDIDRVSLKSFDGVYEMKFHSDGYLYTYKNNSRVSRVPKQSGGFGCFTKRILRFENMNLNIYGNDENGNYDLRGHVSLPVTSMYADPASIILTNNGELAIYDLGINKRA